MQKDLDRADVVPVQVLFKIPDVLIPVVDDPVEVDAAGVGLAAVQLLDLADEDVLIVRAVEDRNFALGRHHFGNAPQEVVRQLVGTGRLESGFIHAVRGQAGQHRADRAVLAGRVHCLEEENDAFLLFGVQLLLQFVDQAVVFLHFLFRILAVVAEACFIRGAC